MKQFRIFLADLTYDTISLSTEAFPLNVGYVASYCIDRFGSLVDVTLFKYIEDLEKALLENPPDILGLSNYAWNHRIGLEMFRIFKEQNPKGVTVWGGPNFPLDIISQEEFMKMYPEVDAYVPVEGEIGFSGIVQRILEVGNTDDKVAILEKPIDGCITRGNDGKPQFSIPSIRIKSLDEIPSPYLNGLMDKFFDGKLSPMLQTNRGCPFSCSYCVDGNDVVRTVNQFSIKRVIEEVNYIAKHVPENTTSMFISDLNFGMIPRDLEICDAIAEVQKKYNFPKQIQATTGKNSKDRVIEAIKRLNGALRIWMSVQSMDQEVLANVRRDNISVDQMLALSPTIKEAELTTVAEVILGLPGESYQSHINTLRDLVHARMEDIQIYTCMMLNGAELNTPEQRHKWGLKTKFRMLPRDFVKLQNGKKVVEIEEVIVSTNTLSFEEYTELRLLAFSIFVTNIGTIYDPIIKLLRENNIDVFELFFKTIKKLNYAPNSIQQLFDNCRKATINELFNSPEEIERRYQNDGNYQKLLDGEEGINVIQFHHALVVSKYAKDWTQYILDIAYELLQEKMQTNDELNNQFRNISNYCYGLCHNLMGSDRMTTNPEYTFDYNIIKWLTDKDESSLIKFKLDSKITLSFKLTEEQYKIVQDKLEIFGNTFVGMGQVIKRIPRKMLWRNPVVETKLVINEKINRN